MSEKIYQNLLGKVYEKYSFLNIFFKQLISSQNGIKLVVKKTVIPSIYIRNGISNDFSRYLTKHNPRPPI